MPKMIPLMLPGDQVDTIFRALAVCPFSEVESTVVNMRSQVQRFVAASQETPATSPTKGSEEAEPVKKKTTKEKPAPAKAEEPKKEIILDDVRVALKDYAAKYGKDKAMSFLSDCGAQKVSEIPADMWLDVINKCKE